MQLHFHYFTRTMTGHMWRRLCKPSLAYMFNRHFAHRTCLGYCWSQNFTSWSSNDRFWRFLGSHANCMEGDSPGTYPSLFHPMSLRLEALTAAYKSFTPYWNLMATVIQFSNLVHLYIIMYLICGINYISVTCIHLSVALFTNSSVDTSWIDVIIFHHSALVGSTFNKIQLLR